MFDIQGSSPAPQGALGKVGAALWLALLMALLMVVSAGAQAQEKTSREREALRRAQQALRAAQEESSSLQRDKSTLATEKDALAKEKDSLSQQARRTAARLDEALGQSRNAQAKLQQLESELAGLRQELAAAKDTQARQASELADHQRLVRTTRALLEASVQKQRILETRNQQLYEVGQAVVAMYRSRNPAETLSKQEPFFGLGVVTLENISEKWLDRLESARYLDQDKLNP